MRLDLFLRDKSSSILLNIFCSIFLAIILFSLGNPTEIVILIFLVWHMILITFYSVHYISRRKYFDNILKNASDSEKKYLISEIIEPPRYVDSITYYTLLKMANKSMLEEITMIKNDRKEYKEYVEQWVHEIKTPISAIKLSGENNKSEVTRLILSELERIDHYVEQALFYARSEHVENDYLIKECSLATSVHSVLVENKQMFIKNKIKVELKGLEKTVYSDHKWVEFILNELLMNSIKYRSDQSPCINIYAEDKKNGVMLVIEDNGIGISSHELPRLFDKGYTGNKGRQFKKSTGIGLYLCKKMCEKLGLLIEIQSKEHEYTKVIIFFPKGRLVKL
ncbi:Signal transduction histidine kinase [Paenibacillus sophorae]|uniref:histidine kinase n=1 Tax=Paenibacillus sophorae TaxID=1333845 RepID=A0A1H8RUE5_9BACL|nr:sensor histidine kinase [Paenibacillus sophorae]QWU16974.1 sensor histidine kinase [Paenibacillus sophorae]SEO69965.1 Signal transduction histidine kinase [Paenibacillus sophorae]